jgi:son of sevenless
MSDTDLAGLSGVQQSARNGAGSKLGLVNGTKHDPEVAGFGIGKRSGTPEPWVRRLADDGMSYYYLNKITGEMQWTIPSSGTGVNGTSGSARDPFGRMRSDSDLSATSRDERNSVYSDGSDTIPTEHGGAGPTPLHRSIDQARENGTLELTAVEQAAHSLQQAMSAPPPASVRELTDAVEAAISAVVETSQSPDFPSTPADVELIQERVNAVVSAVRDLLYISALPSGSIPPEALPDGSDLRALVPGAQSLQAQLKPAQRKVTATLSKLVLSVRALQYDSEQPVRDASARLEGDALDLTQALNAFVMDIQRFHRHSRIGAKRVYGAFSPDNIGLGLVGGGAAASWKGFGWVALDDEGDVPTQMLGVPVVAELNKVVAQLSNQLVSFSAVVLAPAPNKSTF